MTGFSLAPREVTRVQTDHRRIVTPIPVPDSIPIIEQLRAHEPCSMSGQPPVVWQRAEGYQVHDRWGNCWIDFSSGVLVSNIGHAHPKVLAAMRQQIEQRLIFNYCFPSEVRARLVTKLALVAPPPLSKVFLLTTGSEATECAVKLCRTYGLQHGGEDKITIVTFTNAFHGRTLGAQMAGGIPALKQWIVHHDPRIVQVPFPDGFRCEDTSFELFEKSLAEQGIQPGQVAGVMTETYQGGNASFAPVRYMGNLRAWCERHDALLVLDEVQAAFGRCGRYWGFEHYGVVPDLICCGKAISSSLPLAAVIGRRDVMDLYPPGSMTSTHGGSPVPVAAALANLEVLEQERLVEHASAMGQVLQPALGRIAQRFPRQIGALHGRGLVAALHMVKPGTVEPDPERAADVVRRCVEKGLLMFAPVGYGGASVKISPPLCIPEAALREAINVLEQAIGEAVSASREMSSATSEA